MFKKKYLVSNPTEFETKVASATLKPYQRNVEVWLTPEDVLKVRESGFSVTLPTANTGSGSGAANVDFTDSLGDSFYTESLAGAFESTHGLHPTKTLVITTLAGTTGTNIVFSTDQDTLSWLQTVVAYNKTASLSIVGDTINAMFNNILQTDIDIQIGSDVSITFNSEDMSVLSFAPNKTYTLEWSVYSEAPVNWFRFEDLGENCLGAVVHANIHIPGILNGMVHARIAGYNGENFQYQVPHTVYSGDGVNIDFETSPPDTDGVAFVLRDYNDNVIATRFVSLWTATAYYKK